MSFRSRMTFVVLWVLSILVVGSLLTAQTQREVIPPSPAPAAVISGADIGFRPDGWKGKARTGTLVVRINGEWVEAVESPRMTPVVR